MRRRWLPPAALYAVLTLVFAAPILGHFASSIPHDAGDPVLNTWILWWNTQRLPLTDAWWNAPMFFPMRGAFALSEVLLGLLPLTAPVQWLTGSPLVAYNTAFVLSFFLCALAAYALALEVTGRQDAAVLSGLAFAFAPYRMGQLAHLQVLAYYGAPVMLLALHRFIRTSQQRWLALFGVAWLVQALSNGYALFHLAILVAFWIIWFARPLARALAIVMAWGVASIPLVPVLLGYRRVHTALHLTRSINEIKGFGVDVGDLFTAPPDVMLWGTRLWPARPETAVFPGLTILLVAALWIGAHWWETRGRPAIRTLDQRVLIGIAGAAALVAASWFAFGSWHLGPLTVSDFRKPFSIAVAARTLALVRSASVRRAWQRRSIAGFYVIAMFGLYLLALGPEPRVFGRPYLYQPPYAWLMELPGFDTLRVPARFAMPAVLCQSLLLALAAARWRPSTSRIRAAALVLLSAGLVADGWARLPTASVPSPAPRARDVSGVVELPAGVIEDFAAIYRATLDGVPIVNGYSGYFPPHYLPLQHALKQKEYRVLHELMPERPLGVSVNLAATGGADIARALGEIDGIVRDQATASWATFVVTPRATPALAFGATVKPATVRANRHPEDIDRLFDGRVETAWGSANNQIGDEEIVVDLGGRTPVGALVLRLGAFAFGFPRLLSIELSDEGRQWTPVWSGETVIDTVRAAVADPVDVPLTIVIGSKETRYLRLRQTGSEPGIPWWIAELEVHRPLGPR
jgi:hypothetical protein